MPMKTVDDQLAAWKAAAPLCDNHQPTVGTRGGCVICALEHMSAALSRISYLTGPPNEMECGPYDIHCNELEVVREVTRMRAELDALRASYGHVCASRDTAVVARDYHFDKIVRVEGMVLRVLDELAK